MEVMVMKYVVITTDEFEKRLEDLTKKDKPLLKRIVKAIIKLEENPYAGKPCLMVYQVIEVCTLENIG